MFLFETFGGVDAYSSRHNKLDSNSKQVTSGDAHQPSPTHIKGSSMSSQLMRQQDTGNSVTFAGAQAEAKPPLLNQLNIPTLTHSDGGKSPKKSPSEQHTTLKAESKAPEASKYRTAMFEKFKQNTELQTISLIELCFQAWILYHVTVHSGILRSMMSTGDHLQSLFSLRQLINFAGISIWCSYLYARLRCLQYDSHIGLREYSQVVMVFKIILCIINQFHPSSISACIQLEAFSLNFGPHEYALRAGLSIFCGITFFSDSAMASVNLIALFVLCWKIGQHKDQELRDLHDKFVTTAYDLKQQAKMKENYIAGMIHDIRNPLSSMICSLDFMRETEKIQDDEDLCNMLEIASHCAEFIISHVGNFLDISKLETSKIDLCASPTEILELVRKIVCMHRFKAENKQIFLRLNATDNIPQLAMIDNSRFTQVLVNLVSNAIKFTSEGGVIVNVYFKENNPSHLSQSIQRNRIFQSNRQLLTLKMESTQELPGASTAGEAPKSQQDTPPPPSSSQVPMGTLTSVNSPTKLKSERNDSHTLQEVMRVESSLRNSTQWAGAAPGEAAFSNAASAVANQKIISAKKVLLSSIMEEQKENLGQKIQIITTNSTPNVVKKGTEGADGAGQPGHKLGEMMKLDSVKNQINSRGSLMGPIQRVVTPELTASISQIEEMDLDISERFHNFRVPLPFFSLNELNATREKVISGKYVQANPFEFCSNEFSQGGGHGSSEQHSQQQLIDQLIDQIKVKRDKKSSSTMSNQVSMNGIAMAGQVQMTSPDIVPDNKVSQQIPIFKNLETIEEELINSAERKMSSTQHTKVLQQNQTFRKSNLFTSSPERHDDRCASPLGKVGKVSTVGFSAANSFGNTGMGTLGNSNMSQFDRAPTNNDNVVKEANLKGILIVEVSDSGIGIDPENLDNLFKPFSSANADHHKQFGGTGLGLWISKIIVELMGGKFSVCSTVGQGSTFSFQFPINYFKNEEYELPCNASDANNALHSLDKTQKSGAVGNQQMLQSNGGGGGSAQNLLPRTRKLTDAATLFTGQRIIILFKNSEDTNILHKRLKIIQDVTINEYKSVDQIDINVEFRGATHVIVFVDDIVQAQHITLQKYRNLERLTLVFVNDTLAQSQSSQVAATQAGAQRRFNHLSSQNSPVKNQTMDSIPKAERNIHSTENNMNTSGENNLLNPGSQFYDYMLKKPYRTEDMFNLLTWIKPRILGKPKKTIQLKPVFEISMMKSPVPQSPNNRSATGGNGAPIATMGSAASINLSGYKQQGTPDAVPRTPFKQQLVKLNKSSHSQRNIFANNSNQLLPKTIKPIPEVREEESSYDPIFAAKGRSTLAKGTTSPKLPGLGGGSSLGQFADNMEVPPGSSMQRGSIPSQKSAVNVTTVFSQSNMLPVSQSNMQPVFDKGSTSFLDNTGAFNNGFPTFKQSGLGNLGAPITTYKILLVDDDDMIQRVMPEVMRLALNTLVNGGEYEIISANSGIEGLNTFIKNQQLVRLIFTDFEMPGMCGPEMVTEIRKIEKELMIGTTEVQQEVKIIGLTGHDAVEIQRQGIQSGMNLVIKKPPQIKDVKDLFRQFLLKGSTTALSQITPH